MRFAMARGSWKWDAEKGELVELAQADTVEEMRKEHERLVKRIEQEERDARPGNYA